MKSFICLLLVVALASATVLVSGSSSPLASRLAALSCIQSNAPVRVTLRVFSGTPDPEWMVQPSSDSARAIQGEMNHHAASLSQVHQSPSSKMGYNGFVVSCIGESQGVLIQGWKAMEQILLASGEVMLRKYPAVTTHVLEHLGKRVSPTSSVAALEFVRAWPLSNAKHWMSLRSEREGETSKVDIPNDPCLTPPVVGPDTPPIYDPDTDDAGCFEEEQSANNCYAYGSDIVTNTFPQPGRGSGTKWTSNDCDNMGAAAVRDGYVYYGTVLPEGQPADGHYVAMLIWPETNFHWIRHDNATYWSHKPGGDYVRNVDNNGNLITDPSQSDFSPWTQFCAYYIGIPSKLTIN